MAYTKLVMDDVRCSNWARFLQTLADSKQNRSNEDEIVVVKDR
jgi:hypothetical protein